MTLPIGNSVAVDGCEQALASAMVSLVVDRMVKGDLRRPVHTKYDYRNVAVFETVETVEMIKIHGDSSST